jgi:hypothetical protein
MGFALMISVALLSPGQARQGVPAVPQFVPSPASSPYRLSRSGLPADPAFFPIGVWLQDPRNVGPYKQAGFNLYVGLWQGPTEDQLAALRAAGMPVICAQNHVGLAHRADSNIVGWMHGDEPDNAQEIRDEKTGERRYGPPIPPSKIVANYQRIRAADPTRPVMLNLGQGVANDDWKGRGPGASLDDYPGYVLGADVVSFDVYPVAGINRPDGADFLWYVAKGVDRLMKWTGGKKVIWNCIECTMINDPPTKATPPQVRAEVWMSLIHGSQGLIYFVHQFKPRFNEHALLDDPEMLSAVTAINHQIQELAVVLNSPTILDRAKVRSSDPKVPIDTMVKTHSGSTYLFAVGMVNRPAEGSFSLRGLPAEVPARVLGENRQVVIRNGQFTDGFAPYDVHIYHIPPATARPRAISAPRP